jgi:hypothetical protein
MEVGGQSMTNEVISRMINNMEADYKGTVC